jgi:hypothetical protein
MRWRDIRFEKPTAADANKEGKVLQMLKSGSFATWGWENLDVCIAWMPLSELPAFDPIPDPPEGWRFVQKGEAFDKRAKVWVLGSKEWVKTWQEREYDSRYVYIVPIDPPSPPEPQYRPFANAAEFEPYRDKWWRYKSQGSDEYNPPVAFNDKLHANQCWQDSFENKVFADDTPFGVHVHT